MSTSSSPVAPVPASSPRRLFWAAAFFSLILHVLAAIFSSGFHDYDEQYSILEFVNYKLGLTPREALPWDFHAEIRPWWQPATLFVLFRGLSNLGIRDPFLWAVFARLATGLLSWAALWLTVKFTLPWFSSARLKATAITMAALLWFLPYIDVRPASETGAGALFFLGLAAVLARTRTENGRSVCLLSPTAALAVGALWGAAFHFRFQSAFLILGAGAWMTVVARTRRRAFLIGGLLAALAVGILVDRWGYGHWTLAAVNYFRENILRGKVDQFGTSPWYFYVKSVFLQGIPPVSLVLLPLVLVAVIRFPLNPLVWAVVPFVAVHSLIGHKELRFLFPLALAVPTLTTLGLAGLNFWQNAPVGRRFWNPVTKTLFAVNLVILAVVVFRPIRFEIPFFEKVYRTSVADDWAELYYLGRNPYEWYSLDSYFYRPPGTELRALSSVAELRDVIARRGGNFGIAWDGPEVELPAKCSPIYRTLPQWVLRSSRLEPIVRKTGALRWTLYECAGPQSVGAK